MLKFNLFKLFKSTSYLGVDLGTSAIKIVELQAKNGHPQLLTYGYVEQPTDIVRSSSSAMENKIIKIIRSIYRQSHMNSVNVVAALPSFSVFNSIISLPKMNKKDLAQAIRWEAKKVVPLPLEEMVLDWKIIPDFKKDKVRSKQNSLLTNKLKKIGSVSNKNKTDNQTIKAGPAVAGLNNSVPNPSGTTKNESNAANGQTSNSLSKLIDLKRKVFDSSSDTPSGQIKTEEHLKVLLTAAPKSLVEKYIRIFKAAELKLLSLETEAFALERSLAGGADAPIMIIDIGSVSSDVVVIDKGVPVLTRSIDTGGVTITQTVMKSLKVDLKRAEQFKRDIGFSASGPGDLPEIIKLAVNPIINEVKYCLDIYFTQNENSSRALEKIILTGGSAFLPDLTNYLSKLLDIKVIIGDPWDKIIYPLELKPVLQELAPRFSVAVGLAMREIY